MLQVHEHATVEDASAQLLPYALEPQHWLPLGGWSDAREYHARVGKLRICAWIRVKPNLDVVLHVAFRAPGLTPSRAADHLAAFLRERLPLQPNTEWQVNVDGRHWIHFQRAYVSQKLNA